MCFYLLDLTSDTKVDGDKVKQDFLIVDPSFLASFFAHLIICGCSLIDVTTNFKS